LNELAPVIIDHPQSVSMTIEQIEFQEEIVTKYFDEIIHPKFSQFKMAKDDAPFTNLQNRYKIFAVSLLLRLTGHFDH